MRILNPSSLTIVGLLIISDVAIARNSVATCFSEGFSTMGREKIEAAISEDRKIEVSRIKSGFRNSVSGLFVTVSTQNILYKLSRFVPDSEMNSMGDQLKKALEKISYSSDDRDISFLGCTVKDIP